MAARECARKACAYLMSQNVDYSRPKDRLAWHCARIEREIAIVAKALSKPASEVVRISSEVFDKCLIENGYEPPRPPWMSS